MGDVECLATISEIYIEAAVGAYPIGTLYGQSSRFVADTDFLAFCQFAVPSFLQFCTQDYFHTAARVCVMHGHTSECRFETFYFLDYLVFGKDHIEVQFYKNCVWQFFTYCCNCIHNYFNILVEHII